MGYTGRVNVKLYNADGDEISVPEDAVDAQLKKGWSLTPPAEPEVFYPIDSE